MSRTETPVWSSADIAKRTLVAELRASGYRVIECHAVDGDIPLVDAYTGRTLAIYRAGEEA